MKVDPERWQRCFSVCFGHKTKCEESVSVPRLRAPKCECVQREVQPAELFISIRSLLTFLRRRRADAKKGGQRFRSLPKSSFAFPTWHSLAGENFMSSVELRPHVKEKDK